MATLCALNVFAGLRPNSFHFQHELLARKSFSIHSDLILPLDLIHRGSVFPPLVSSTFNLLPSLLHTQEKLGQED